MAEKSKKNNTQEYNKIKTEKVFDAVNTVFRDRPKDYIAKLEEIGFEYHEEEDTEALEESAAEPLNNNQRELVLYFEGRKKLSKKLFEMFLAEKDAEEPNYPLFRKYFKQANQRLKALLLYGLDRYPGRFDLLDDLSFFHEYENMLSTLITYYTRACVLQENPETFTRLAMDFYYCTDPDGYDALQALRDVFPPETDKGKIIAFLIDEEKRQEQEAFQPVSLTEKEPKGHTLH